MESPRGRSSIPGVCCRSLSSPRQFRVPSHAEDKDTLHWTQEIWQEYLVLPHEIWYFLQGHISFFFCPPSLPSPLSSPSTPSTPSALLAHYCASPLVDSLTSQHITFVNSAQLFPSTLHSPPNSRSHMQHPPPPLQYLIQPFHLILALLNLMAVTSFLLTWKSTTWKILR